MFGAAEFAPEIFGISADRLFAISGSLVTSALGFLFLYLLKLPITRLPFIDAPADWRPPPWALGLFALGSTAALAFTVALGITLEFTSAAPPSAEIAQHYQFIREVPLEDLDAIRSAAVVLEDYDGSSDLRIVANGYVQFSTSTNCMLSYQCKPVGTPIPSAARPIFEGPPLGHPSLFRVKQLYALPLQLAITNFLVPGDNFVDVISGNSGVGNCRVRVSLSVSNGSEVARKLGVTLSGAKGPIAAVRARANPEETFFAEYLSQGSDSQPTEHPVYRTLEANASYRLCARVRFSMSIFKNQLAWRTTDAWHQWAQARRQREECEVRNGTDRDCTK